jgi:hypothetical protein
VTCTSPATTGIQAQIPSADRPELLPSHLVCESVHPQDRVHRLGQTRPVFVWRYVARGTIEERMLEMQVCLM